MGDWIMYQSDGVNDICPVDENILIEVMMLDGEIWNDELAGSYSWDVIDEAGEIIAYKLPITQHETKEMETVA